MITFNWIYLVIFVYNFPTYEANQCYVDTDKVSREVEDKWPLMINDDGSFIYPQNDKAILRFTNSKTFTFICPRNRAELNNIETPKLGNPSWFVSGKCHSAETMYFPSADMTYDIAYMSCSYTPKSTIKEINPPKDLKLTDNKDYRYFGLGFNMPNKFSNPFKSVVEVCYDVSISRSIFAFHVIQPSINRRQKYPDNKTLSFSHERTNWHLQFAYVRDFQLKLFQNRFGQDQTYIKFKGEMDDQYLERGHLAPRADFYYNSQQEATFFYVNTAPMWKTINSGNWVKLEYAVRCLSISKKQLLYVWTGAKRILHFILNKTLVPVYIQSRHEKADKSFHVKVPKYLFKLVYEPESQRAVVFITINNPFWVKNNHDLLCTNVLESIRWKPNFDYRHKYLRGFVFACTYSDFKDKFKSFLPKLQVRGLLTEIS